MAISNRYLGPLLLKPLFGSFLDKKGIDFQKSLLCIYTSLVDMFFYEFGGRGSWIGEKHIYP